MACTASRMEFLEYGSTRGSQRSIPRASACRIVFQRLTSPAQWLLGSSSRSMRRLRMLGCLLPMLACLRRLFVRNPTACDVLCFLPPAVQPVPIEATGPNTWRRCSSTVKSSKRRRGRHQLASRQEQMQHQLAVTAGSSSGVASTPVLPVWSISAGLLAICLFTLPAETFAATAALSADFGAIVSKASASALKGGVAGFFAGQAQVLAFMWLRTAMNYQYAFGGSFQLALAALYKEGGIPRFYKGLWLAIFQAPLSRFGDVAANGFMLVFMESFFPEFPLPLKTAAGSLMASVWRVLITPLDSLKTNLQVNGSEAFIVLRQRVQDRGFFELYAGFEANFVANFVGNFPYFLVFNSLSEAWPAPEDAASRIVRNGVMGMCASTASDLVSNSFRVLKTVRQSQRDASSGYSNPFEFLKAAWDSYFEAARSIVSKDGWRGLAFRGLETRILVNILQGSFFAIVWKLVEEQLAPL